jgi:hypothetical protein
VNLGAETVDRIVKEHVGSEVERFVWGRFAHEGSGSFAFDAVMHVFEEKMIDGEEWLVNDSGQRIIPSRALESCSYQTSARRLLDLSGG